MASSASASQSPIKYKRLRVPRQHGVALQIPPLSQSDQVLKSNLKLLSLNQWSHSPDLTSLRKLARIEIVDLANRYSHSYLDRRSELPHLELKHGENTGAGPIVMAGHQPELFHPGVWYKNFALSKLGERFNATAINLVVDNDLSGNTSIRFPKAWNDQVSLGSLPIIRPGPNVPFENRIIEDQEFFQSFDSRVNEAIKQSNGNWSPMVNRLWPHVLESRQKLTTNGQLPRLGQLLAAGRHRLESSIGLRTLEVPISLVARTQSFAIFAQQILSDLSRFHTAYNESLTDYRVAHRIRSRSHPVPELETDGDWLETPFWFWHVCDEQKSDLGYKPADQGSLPRHHRQRLFAKRVANKITLSNRNDWKAELEASEFADQFQQLVNSEIAIRPKALMTTMFSRLLVSDLFLHGIGGAKYDQLTDVICERYFGAKLPKYLTLSATMKLPTDVEIIRKSDLNETNQLIRELKYHPELLIHNPSPKAVKLIEEKRRWTIGERANWRSRQKHLKIESLNESLKHYVDFSVDDLIAKRNTQMKNLRASEILDSREYSFCMFPQSLVDELQKLADW
ncbi:MAG: hypothetical protein AB8B55_02730 [Mariniblastus sp.]